MKNEFVKLFEDLGVILDGHFLLTSGKHSPTFLQCSQLMQHPEHTEKVIKELAKEFHNTDAEVVVGPAMGGIILSYELARHLGLKAIYAEKSENGMEFRRGFNIKPGTKVLVVEDAVSTGGSVKKTMEACEKASLDVIGVAIVVDRSNGKVKLHENQHSLITLDIPAYDSDDCPLCKENKPLISPKDLSM
jgi:orotate phosphoribosyltransferase